MRSCVLPRTRFAGDLDLAVLLGAALGHPGLAPLASAAAFSARTAASPDHYEIVAVLPGLVPDDLSLDQEGNDLSIAIAKPGREARRSFRFPDDAQLDQMEAKLALGELTVRVPRQAPAAASRKIPVQAG